MPFGILLHTAQTRAQTASHHIFERGFTRRSALTCILRHRLHHGLRTTRGYVIELFALQQTVLGYEPLFSCRRILGSYEHSAVFCEIVKLQNVPGRTSAKQESRFHIALQQFLAQIEQRSRANSPAHKQFVPRGGMVKPFPKGKTTLAVSPGLSEHI